MGMTWACEGAMLCHALPCTDHVRPCMPHVPHAELAAWAYRAMKEILADSGDLEAVKRGYWWGQC